MISADIMCRRCRSRMPSPPYRTMTMTMTMQSGGLPEVAMAKR